MSAPSPRGERRLLAWSTLSALAWGFAEGVFLFLVPDVLLSFLALRGWRHALLSTLAVVVGAAVAATYLYSTLHQYGEAYARTLRVFWEHLPGFRPAMQELAAQHLRDGGARGFTYGPSSGIPYRLYVVEAWRAGIPLRDVLLWTPIARLERIALAPLAVLALRTFVLGWLLPRAGNLSPLKATRFLAGLIALYWVLLYVWYWFFFLPKAYP